VFSLTKASDKPDQINPGIERVARTLNLYVSAGVPLDHLKFVAVAYGAATGLVLDDEHYRAQFGTANPNLAVISQLRKAGVDVAVCGQAMSEHHYPNDWASKDVTLSLSALTTITMLEQQGYALMPL
jgi:intracellular sulfur oxidation DsrE/DsrF family protein